MCFVLLGLELRITVPDRSLRQGTVARPGADLGRPPRRRSPGPSRPRGPTNPHSAPAPRLHSRRPPYAGESRVRTRLPCRMPPYTPRPESPPLAARGWHGRDREPLGRSEEPAARRSRSVRRPDRLDIDADLGAPADCIEREVVAAGGAETKVRAGHFGLTGVGRHDRNVLGGAAQLVAQQSPQPAPGSDESIAGARASKPGGTHALLGREVSPQLRQRRRGNVKRSPPKRDGRAAHQTLHSPRLAVQRPMYPQPPGG